ncbi:MAG: hypothetical protein A2787_04980 [Omnitrophica WOR_2 bacterium RIFCSPHIGHO2_01_FULL_48_9]|nr:MAG: hypothetical protein A3D10_02335 [Omnitrophica WOR_2 bacterium RIFCSPHIGHO2_02_FULL_48_11]OGX30579.1 MAG: hypothetical protein A2787_04980 [Omnitrophica WOR_2 bacterium RIFCSPHIGHO2_01_FULL_48_9]
MPSEILKTAPLEDIVDGNIKKHLSQNPLIRGVVEKFNEDVAQLAASCRPQNILDIGCGEGFTTVQIAKQLPQTAITGIDLMPERIRYAEAKNKAKNIVYQTADMFRLPFSENAFDLVVCNEVLEHLENYTAALEVLKKFARKFILISVPNEPWFRSANVLRLHYLSRWGSTPGHINHWTRSGIYRAAGACGEVVQLKTSTLWNILLIKK